MWSRHLLYRIEVPMKQFESNQNVMASKDAKRIIKVYNKLAKTLVAFEFLWYKAWVQAIDQAKTGLQATLIIRHPRMGSRSGMFILNSLNSRPFSHVDVQLMPPRVSLSPSLDDIQECINQSAQAIISCYKTVFNWGILLMQNI